MILPRFFIILHILFFVVVVVCAKNDQIKVLKSNDIVSISYRDLIKNINDNKDIIINDDDNNNNNHQNTKELVTAIAKAFGPHGLGIIQVTDIPLEYANLRLSVLKMAHALAHLPQSELTELETPEKYYSIGWSHGKEQLKPGVYDLSKGSFYMDPFQNENNIYPQSLQPNFEKDLMKLAKFISDCGLQITKLCDKLINNNNNNKANNKNILFESLKSCKNVKARLLHYFPSNEVDDESILVKDGVDKDNDDEWCCGWHTDHGSLTGLVPALFLNDATGDPIINNDEPLGLHIQTKDGNIYSLCINAPNNSLLFQIGETMQLQSLGQLHATPHAVKTSSQLCLCSRETLAVFLQPEPNEPLPRQDDESNLSKSLQERWRPTFGAFQQATLKAFN